LDAIFLTLSLAEWRSRTSFNVVPIKISQVAFGDSHDITYNCSLAEMQSVASGCCNRRPQGGNTAVVLIEHA
jgi:hypothetical protein